MDRQSFGLTTSYAGTLPPIVKFHAAKKTEEMQSKAPLEEKPESSPNESNVEPAMELVKSPAVESAVERPAMDSAVEEPSKSPSMETTVEEPAKEEIQQVVEEGEMTLKDSPNNSDKKSEEIPINAIFKQEKMKSLRKSSKTYSFVYCEVGPDCIFNW